jgi:hypothetical protein
VQGNTDDRFAFVGHLLDRFDLETFGVMLTIHGTSKPHCEGWRYLRNQGRFVTLCCSTLDGVMYTIIESRMFATYEQSDARPDFERFPPSHSKLVKLVDSSAAVASNFPSPRSR